MKITKDNMTDLVDLLLPKPTDDKTPQITPPQGLNDYQVYTPNGEIIDLTLIKEPTILEKAERGTSLKKILDAKDKKGNQYILVVIEKTS